MIKFKSILSPKMSEIVDLGGVGIDKELPTYEKRIYRFIERLFGKDKIEDKAYWSVLYEMLNNPQKLFGIVAIDGYASDPLGTNDLGLILNMGKPRLRARNIHYLDRIYVSIRHDGRLEFYNSTVDNQDKNAEVNFDFQHKTVAFHPHISNGGPCLGGYETSLSRWRYDEKNPIMYLRTIHQYLNTWNSRSPYFNINQEAMKYKFEKDGLVPRVFTKGQLYSLRSFREGRSHGFLEFLERNIFLIKSEDPQSELQIIHAAYMDFKIIKRHIKDVINNQLPDNIKSYLSSFKEDLIARTTDEDYTGWPNVNWTQLHTGEYETRYRRDHLQKIEYELSDDGDGYTRLKNAHTPFNELNNSTDYLNKLNMLNTMGRALRSIFCDFITTEDLDNVCMEYESEIVRLYAMYYAPFIKRKEDIYKELTESHNLKYRVSNGVDIRKTLHLEVYETRKKIKNTQARKEHRINRIVTKKVLNNMGEIIAEKLLNAKVAQEFTYNTYYNDFINSLQMCDGGDFFTMGGYTNLDSPHFERAINILDIDVDPKKQEPMTFDKITKIYESLKRELYKDRLKAKIETVNKLQRKAGWIYNGREFNNTPQDSKQVPLSFDSI